MDREEIQKEMRFHLEKYTELKNQLDSLNKNSKRDRIEKTQRAFFEDFKGKYTVYAHMSGPFESIDWSGVEAKIFSDQNLDSVAAVEEGYYLGYNEIGMPGIASSYRGGGTFSPIAYDEVDAERYREREERRRKIAAKSR